MAGSRNRFIKRKPTKKVVKPARTRAQNRRSSSTKTTTIPASKRPADMRRGVTYGDAGRPYKGPGGNPNGSGQGQARQAPPAPKLPPKPTAPKPRKPAASTAPVKSQKVPTKAKPKAATAANAQNLRSGPTPPKPKRKTSTTQGPTKSGSYYKGKVKSSRLSSALSNLKVRDYKKKK